MNTINQFTENYNIPDNEALLKTWLRLSTSIINNRLVSEMSYNESLVCSILYSHTKLGISMTATELCHFTKMLKSQMNRTLNLLEEKKLILRQRSDTDKRQVMILFNMEHAQAYENQHQKIDLYQLAKVPFKNIEKELPTVCRQRTSCVILTSLFSFQHTGNQPFFLLSHRNCTPLIVFGIIFTTP